jgi:hypothetical protein
MPALAAVLSPPLLESVVWAELASAALVAVESAVVLALVPVDCVTMASVEGAVFEVDVRELFRLSPSLLSVTSVSESWVGVGFDWTVCVFNSVVYWTLLPPSKLDGVKVLNTV